MNKTYQSLCSQFYELDKPTVSDEILKCYLSYAKDLKGPILEPMCGTGRFLIPFLERGFRIEGFDSSPHMLDICQKKCEAKGLKASLKEASFETFSSDHTYDLIFIPSGSFGLLTSIEDVNSALKVISDSLQEGGKFVFEIETLKAVSESQNSWKERFVKKGDLKITLKTKAHFDLLSKIETTVCKYELWEDDKKKLTETEDFKVKLYEFNEIDPLLTQNNLKVLGKWQLRSDMKIAANENSDLILYECVKI
ncbi:class I SAM-dependent DNA methyltransferase [Criblamydia sequanensis]|uniref:Methyltransferase n=1 Tax=Candidatus Criblamydia sequanensis CRIB-18 TaxID=1437425 RepID=A0A090DXX8_9BACT|nr:class I SAM-dependent methyltransferase [Criblamydia sequanensis]CDR33629.1 Methyltransferase [Criblamydia sequanensis CRIB-18]